MTFYRGFVAASLALATLGACSSRSEDPNLMNIAAAQRGPDEFSILPTEPLQAPPDFQTLPPPTPGGSNLVDQNPQAEAIEALGGRSGAAQGGGVPAADSALGAHVARYGTSDEIRQQLAAEDLEHRRRNNGRILERLFGANVYHRAYRDQELDREAELERWRQAGARTPTAPPPDAP
ncbi:MAG: Beta-barrel assembly machine subunit BamF [Rhodobacteraceae bacterium HLUCCA12]|nr:MAG: Beta-barrel assembly machine subunit BamF [Rhodobacteraceae bacterium HLUCCA12]